MAIRFQISLKWFLLATTLVAVLAGTVGKRAYDYWKNDFALGRRGRAIRDLEEFGVHLESRGEIIVKASFPTGPVKARYFRMASEIKELEEFGLSSTGFTDADAPTLIEHPKLQTLNLSGNPKVTDKALKSIAQIKSLKNLELWATAITDDGLKEIARLPKLERLNLSSTDVTSRGIVHLRPLRSLFFLGLVDTKVDDADIEAIGELRSLRQIVLDRTKVQGPGLKHLAKLPNLKMLQLRGCPLQDGSGLAELKQLRYLYVTDTRIALGVLSHIHEMDNLRELDLNGSAINDWQLVELANATQLTSLSVGRTSASKAAFRELKVKLPNTRIYGEPRDP